MSETGTKVLIVDDEPNALRFIEYALQAEGYEVVTAESGLEGLNKVRTEHPDLVILDVTLPDLSGIEVCQQLRSQPETSDLPIIMLSARAQVPDKIRGLQAGADEYVTKPIDPDEMVARVIALLKTRAHVALKLAHSSTLGKGQILAVYGPKGGVGRTFIAVNLAIALNSVTKGQVVLVDGNVELGDIDLVLNFRAAYNIVDLVLRVDELDQELINRVLISHPSGIAVLPSSSEVDAGEVMQAAPIQTILASLQDMFDYVVVDLWPIPDPCTEAILNAADKVLLVVTPEIASLRNTYSFLQRAELPQFPPDRFWVILNRFGAKSEIKLPDLERALNRKIAAKIPSDEERVVASLNLGVPLVVSHPKSAVARSLMQLAETIAG